MTWKNISQQTQPDVGWMLGQRRRRWPNIQPTWGQRFVFADLFVGKHSTQ